MSSFIKPLNIKKVLVLSYLFLSTLHAQQELPTVLFLQNSVQTNMHSTATNIGILKKDVSLLLSHVSPFQASKLH